MDFLLGSVITIVAFFLGFFTAFAMEKSNIFEPRPLKMKMIESMKKISHNKSEGVGVVHRPTQQDILEKTDPLSIANKEEREAMRETLSPIFDT